MRRSIIITLLAASLSLMSGPAAADHQESADILDQGEGPALVTDGARLTRTSDGLSVRTAMPTPEPDSYTYPQSGVFSGPGHPEGFTLWAFVFNVPAGCTDPCNGDDLGDTPAQGGAFFVTGHLVGGKQLTLAGRISTQDSPAVGAALQNPLGAEVHLAVAPHGGLDSSAMPDQIKTPTGPPSVWWVALFK